MPTNDIQLGKGYISPSALQFAAVWPLTKPCLGIITVCSPSFWQLDPMWDKYKVNPVVIQEEKLPGRKRPKLMLLCVPATASLPWWTLAVHVWHLNSNHNWGLFKTMSFPPCNNDQMSSSCKRNPAVMQPPQTLQIFSHQLVNDKI